MEKITLRAARVNKGLSRREVAEMAKITPESIGNYERGARIPRVDILLRLLAIYEVPFDQIDLRL